MAQKKEKPYKKIAIRSSANGVTTTYFSIDDDLGAWIDPCDDTLRWIKLQIYGIPNKKEDAETNEIDEDDFTSAEPMGEIFGCHIAKSLIVNLGEDPYTVCDDEDSDLESMYSVIKEHEDDEDFIDWVDDIFYIHEIEFGPAYQNMGYEKIILLQLPSIIVTTLHIFPSLLMYFPSPIQHNELERDEEAEAILRHRLDYLYQGIGKEANDDNICMFPPMRDIPEKEVNRFLGRRNPGDTIPEGYRNHDLYKLYKSAGFKEVGKTGWLYKRICNIFNKDGLNS